MHGAIDMTRRGLPDEFRAAILFYAALALTFLLYLPGLSGGFLFDDFSNLAPLDGLASGPTMDLIVQFLSHGISSPSGRPVSLATFAAQATDWPSNPGGFLRINLLLHLLNGALLFWALLIVSRLMQLPERARLYLPLASVVLWLIAPIQVTAVLYVVQRMTELSATFVFSGLTLYLVGREQALRGANRAWMAWMSAGMLWGAGVGVFAKENAVLLPLLVLALEYTLLAGVPRPAGWRRWSAVFLALPILALVAYLLLKTQLFAGGYALREFTLGQRLMTEARVLFMYAYKLLLPWPSAIRLLYDDFPASRSLLEPWTTLVSVLGVGGLAALAWRCRGAAPMFAFAVLWFLAAHVLESTVVPLELVFEHRNYQAVAGVWFAIAAGVLLLWRRFPGRLMRTVLVGASAAYVFLLSVVTWQIASLWGRPFEMAAWQTEIQPDSKRARLEFMGALLRYGYVDSAAKVAEGAARQWPDDPLFHLNMVQISCLGTSAGPPPVAEVTARLRSARSEILSTVNQMDALMAAVEEGSCPGLAPQTMSAFVEAALENPRLQVQRQNLMLLRARALRREGRREDSRRAFREAVEIKPVVILLIQGVIDELDAKRVSDLQLNEARDYLEMAESDPRISAVDRWSHRNDLASLRHLLELHEAQRR